MLEIFQYDFMIRAFIAGITIAIIAPLIGNFLVVRRLSLIADTLSHVALAGVAIGLLTKSEPILTTIIFTTIASLLIERLRTTSSIPGETVLAMFLPVGLALSLILIQLANGFNVNLFAYLFGSITTVTTQDIQFIVSLGILTVAIVGFLYNKLLFTSFDEESAKVSGVPVAFVNTILTILTAVTVTIAMRVVGILLIGALMVIPVTTAIQLGKSFFQTVIISLLAALLAVVGGLFVSFYFNLPAGATIVICSFTLFGIATLFKKK